MRVSRQRVGSYLKHKVANAPVELGAVVVLLAAKPQKILRHARHDVAVDLHVDVALRCLQLAVSLLGWCIVWVHH